MRTETSEMRRTRYAAEDARDTVVLVDANVLTSVLSVVCWIAVLTMALAL